MEHQEGSSPAAPREEHTGARGKRYWQKPGVKWDQPGGAAVQRQADPLAPFCAGTISSRPARGAGAKAVRVSSAGEASANEGMSCSQEKE